MPSVNQLLNEKLRLYEMDDLFKEVRKVQRATFKESIDFYIAERNKLEGKTFLQTGSAAATAVNQFERRMSIAIERNAGYKSQIRKYMTNFDRMDFLNSKIHKALNKIDISGVIRLANKQKRGLVGGTVEKIVGEISRFPQNMLGDEMREQFTKPVKKLLYENIMQGKPQGVAKKALHNFIVGKKGKIGQLERWSGQIARDTLSQYDGAVNDMVRKEFDLDAYRYIGSLVVDSRPQCVRWITEKKGILPYDELTKEISWAYRRGKGMISDTTKDNFATYRGGYNCQHSAIATRLEEKQVLTK
jgi:hypothetical protein